MFYDDQNDVLWWPKWCSMMTKMMFYDDQNDVLWWPKWCSMMTKMMFYLFSKWLDHLSRCLDPRKRWPCGSKLSPATAEALPQYGWIWVCLKMGCPYSRNGAPAIAFWISWIRLVQNGIGWAMVRWRNLWQVAEGWTGSLQRCKQDPTRPLCGHAATAFEFVGLEPNLCWICSHVYRIIVHFRKVGIIQVSTVMLPLLAGCRHYSQCELFQDAFQADGARNRSPEQLLHSG